MEGLLQLLQLQEVDKDLRALEEAKEKYPAEISERQGELERARATLEVSENELEELARQQRHHERELDITRNSLKEHEERFAEVTNNREYDALQLEIESCKTRISEHETHILEAIEAMEQLQEQVETAKQDYAEVERAQRARIDELQTKLASLQDEVTGVEAQRRTVVDSIASNYLQVYERSRKQKGLRVAPVRKGSCGVCFRQLPAQQKSNVRHSSGQIEFCESCGAILVWAQDSE